MSVHELAHPEWLRLVATTAAAALAALTLARLWARRRRRALLGRAAPLATGHLVSDTVLWFALLSIGLALLGPRWGERVVWSTGGGVDVVFLVDVSKSMDVPDVPPSRLLRARRAVTEILTRLGPRDRAALAAFAGRGVLLTPLTPDLGALAELVSALDTRLVHPASSRLGEGVRAGVAAFAAFGETSERPRVLFVLSDGEDPEGGGDLGIGAARRSAARVLAAALGTDLGAVVPGSGAPLLHADGTPVLSRRRSERLERLAVATGGVLFSGDAWGAFDFDRAAAAIRRDAATAEGEPVARRVSAVQVVPFAAFSLLLLLVEGLPRPRRPRGARTAALAATLAVLVPGVASPPVPVARASDGASEEESVETLEARLRSTSDDARLLVRLGLARLERGHAESAARAFRAAAVTALDPATARTAYYDLGVAALQDGDLEQAREAFFDALAFAPHDREARFNLEWTLASLQSRPPQPPAPLQPDPSRDEDSGSDPDPQQSADADEPESQAPPPATEAERRRWLDRVQDDPARALRAFAGGREGQPRVRTRAVW